MKPVRKILGSIRNRVRKSLLIRSITTSSNQRGERDLKKNLETIVPSLSDQYSSWVIDMKDRYIVEKIRSMHTFQINLVLKALKSIECNRSENISVVDIGDSSGTHLIYLKHFISEFNFKLDLLSLNLDELAVERIKRKGMNAILCRAEELSQKKIKADVFLCFETLEHLLDPIRFMHSISTGTDCIYFVLSVPYVRHSRVGMDHIRNNLLKEVSAENTHIFEFCTEDWDRIFQFSGWEVVFRDKYTQYPKRGLLNLMKYIWRRMDFDGFYGVILRRDHKIMRLYKDWGK